MTKLERLKEEMPKLRDKIARYQARLREMERKKKELENTEILELVRGSTKTRQELTAFLHSIKDGNVNEHEQQFMRSLTQSQSDPPAAKFQEEGDFNIDD